MVYFQQLFSKQNEISTDQSKSKIYSIETQMKQPPPLSRQWLEHQPLGSNDLAEASSLSPYGNMPYSIKGKHASLGLAPSTIKMKQNLMQRPRAAEPARPGDDEHRIPSKAATIGDQNLRVRVNKVIQNIGQSIGGPDGSAQGLDGGLQEIMDINARMESDLGIFMKRTRERETKEDEFLKKLKAMKEF